VDEDPPQAEPAPRRRTFRWPAAIALFIAAGRLDALVPVGDAERFARDIRQSRVLIYEGVGHVPMEEVPGRSAADAESFLLEDRLTGR